MRYAKIKYLCFIFLFILLSNSVSYSQESADSSYFNQNFFRMNQLRMGLDKQLNTYLFNNYFKYGLQSGNFFAGMREIFNSTILNTSAKNIKDEHNLLLSGGYKLNSDFSIGLNLNNIVFSDDRYTQINKTALLTSSLFVNYTPLPNISITPFAGISNNQQINVTDKGVIYGSDLTINSLMISDFELNSQMKFQNEDISPRKNVLRNLTAGITNKFEDTFINTVTGSYFEQRKDFYFTADPATALEFGIENNIQSRTEKNYVIQNRFRSVPVNEGFNLDLTGLLYYRTIDRNTRFQSTSNTTSANYDTQINEFKLDLNGGIDYRSKSLFTSIKFSVAQYEEKHAAKKIDGVDFLIFSDRDKLEYKKNNQAETATLSLYTNWSISEDDNFIFSIFHRKLKYDTPSSENYDDRDELLTIGRIGYERKLSSQFKLNLNLEGSFNKIVYIFSERSSNNNMRRFLKFSSTGYFNNSIIQSMNSAEVSANYTTFDYEYLNPSLRSYSFRQFIFRDSTSSNLSRHVKLLFNGYIKLSEQGDFDWAEFTERPARSLNEKLFEPKLGYTSENLSINWGIRYFNLSTYSVNSRNEKTLASEYRSIGPLTEVRYRIKAKIDLFFYGWYEFIDGTDGKREIPNVILKLNWEI